LSGCIGGAVAEWLAESVPVLGFFAGCIGGAAAGLVNAICNAIGKPSFLKCATYCAFFDLFVGTVLGCLGGFFDPEVPENWINIFRIWIASVINSALGTACGNAFA
jgi:hypothetical protein